MFIIKDYNRNIGMYIAYNTKFDYSYFCITSDLEKAYTFRSKKDIEDVMRFVLKDLRINDSSNLKIISYEEAKKEAKEESIKLKKSKGELTQLLLF